MKKTIMLTSLFAILCYTSCEHTKEENKEETRFLVTNPVKMDTIITESYVSQIRSIQHIELRALERGYLQQIFVDEGQFVRAGQLLFKIMPRLYEAELRSAAAEVRFAEIEYENTKRLSEGNIVAPNELAMAEAKLEKAKAEQALAQVHLDFTEIRAPFDGIIDRFHVRLGSLLDEGDLLTHLSDNSRMWVYYNVPEATYLDYQSEMKGDRSAQVSLVLANNKVFDYAGVVETIEADFNNETGNIPFRATFLNPKGLLRHGETGNVVLNIPLKGALLIPQKATFEILDKNYVFVVDKNNTIKSREITIAEEMPHIYVVQAGLTENDKVLLEGLRLVRENDTISYDLMDPKEVISGLKLYAE
ncbi:MAG: efflux RND transporter periplasmic adaptor subunit [Roseivirga sp.]|nr:efflux RND transporter periplasmic adaptor subunit [Roseivirga sp.]